MSQSHFLKDLVEDLHIQRMEDLVSWLEKYTEFYEATVPGAKEGVYPLELLGNDFIVKIWVGGIEDENQVSTQATLNDLWYVRGIPYRREDITAHPPVAGSYPIRISLPGSGAQAIKWEESDELDDYFFTTVVNINQEQIDVFIEDITIRDSAGTTGPTIIDPDASMSEQLKLYGTYNIGDLTTELTTGVFWDIQSNVNATIDQTGLVTVTDRPIGTNVNLVVTAEFNNLIDDHTVEILGLTITLDALTINGPVTIFENQSSVFTADAQYNTGLVTNVDAYNWHIQNGPFTNVNINSDTGVLTVGELTEDIFGVVIGCDFTDVGTTVSATHTVNLRNKEATGINIIGVTDIDEGNSAQYTITVDFNDGTSESGIHLNSEGVDWSLTAPPAFTSVNADGLLVVTQMTPLEDGTQVTINADYNYKGTVVSDSHVVTCHNVVLPIFPRYGSVLMINPDTQAAIDPLTTAFIRSLPQQGTTSNKYETFTIDTGQNLVSNHSFDNATQWQLGSGWSISNGSATHVSGVSSDISQDIAITEGVPYSLIYTVAGRTQGSITVSLGGATGAQRTTNTTFVDIITAGTGEAPRLRIEADNAFDGSITEITVRAGISVFGFFAYPVQWGTSKFTRDDGQVGGWDGLGNPLGAAIVQAVDIFGDGSDVQDWYIYRTDNENIGEQTYTTSDP